ncbi:MAG: DUF2207 domain-containing protein [Nitrospirae bacterium]|nr:DUF2207 domain-containing protein [Nitrospirota bacterium]MCL5422058.1 DUF2207 domain-containing protein [Nitrospirota bacterium]
MFYQLRAPVPYAGIAKAKMVKRLLRFFLLFLVVLAAAPVSARDFTINKFHSDIIINDDASFTVKETLEVEFHRPKHGIYREIPFSYTDDLGSRMVTPMEIISVTDPSGKKWNAKVDNRNNVVHIRIGDKDRYVSGNQTYVIFYKVENALLFFDDHDELYWNVTGNYWNAPIKEASANVMLAAKSRSTTLWASCYTGAYRSRESQCRYETLGNYAEFFLKKSLNPGEGFTIAFGWDKGLVPPPSGWKMFVWKIKENWSFTLPVFSLIFMINLWRKRGRDPRVRESITVTYEPPRFGNKPLSPSEVGAIVDEKLDPRDITSSIVGLAVKGYIKVEETKREGLIFDSTDYYLSKVKEPDADLSSFERELITSTFSGSLHGISVSEMKNKFYTNLESLKKTLYGELEGKKYFLRSPEKVRAFYTVAAVAVAAVAIPVAIFLTQSLSGSGSFTSAALFKSALSGLLAGLPVFAFARVMPAKTKAGASVYMDILGFQEFMNRAEKDRLERMGDKNLFSKFLPYAIALDVADNWAKAFEGIYQNPPDWYVSPEGFRTFSPHTFSHSVSSMTSSLGTAMFSTPRGSGISGGGSGGGGSSGGGFGGGGGGSW